MLKMKLQAKGESPPTIIRESTYKTAMKSEPSATTMTNDTFTRRQSVCGSHLPYVTPSAGCGLPLFRLSGKLFKTEISYKRRERAEYIQQNKADTSQFSAMKSPVPAESGGKLTSPVRTCARGRLPQAALWTQALNCCQRWSAAGLATQLTLSIRQPVWSSYYSHNVRQRGLTGACSNPTQ